MNENRNPILEMIFNGPPKDVTIKNGHSSLFIPEATINAIKSLAPEDKNVVLEKMSSAIETASSISLTSKK